MKSGSTFRQGVLGCLVVAVAGCNRAQQERGDRSGDQANAGAQSALRSDVSDVGDSSAQSAAPGNMAKLPENWMTVLKIGEVRHNRKAIIDEAQRNWINLRQQTATLPAGLKRDEIAMILLSAAPNNTLFADFFMEAWESRSSLNDGIVGKWLNTIADRESLDLSVDVLKRLNARPDGRSVVGFGDLQRLVAKQTILESSPEEAFSRLKTEGGLIPGLDMKGAFLAALADELKPDQTTAFIDRHLADLASTQGTGGIAAFAENVGFQNPDGYFGKVDQWSVAMQAPRIATGFTSRWLDVDSQAATRWMGQLAPSPTLDGAIHALFLSGDILKSADRATLEQWAGRVSDPEIKSFVMKKLAH